MLSSHVGVYDTCLRVLTKRGYEVSVRGEIDEDGEPIPSELLWIARRGAFEFRADNPVELLGLCAIEWEVAPAEPTPRWWVVEGEDLLRETLKRAFPGCSGRL